MQYQSLDKVRTIFTKVEDIGDNYIIGIVPITNVAKNTEVHPYADTDGWFVAYLAQEEPASKIMKWPASYDNYSKITKITTTTLRDALNDAGRAAAVRIPTEIKYYDFRFPDANAMTLFVKASPRGSNWAITQVKIPDDYTLYEASYYLSGANVGPALKIDGANIGDVSYYNEPTYKGINSYKGTIAVGVLHTIEVRGACAVATVLIYKTID